MHAKAIIQLQNRLGNEKQLRGNPVEFPDDDKFTALNTA
jgi:hypothetical protein